MGQIQRLSRGQVKPYNSVPRIDWSHPLAAGLSTYCYDIGGSVFDLVNGGHITTVGTSGSQQTQFGRALQFPLTGYGYMPPLPPGKINPFGGNTPYSAAMGTLQLAGAIGPSSPDSAHVSVQDAGNSQNTAFGFNTFPLGSGNNKPNPTMACVFGNVTANEFNQLVLPNVYQSWAMSGVTGTATQYSNGVFDTTFSGFVSDNGAVTNGQIMYNTASINSGQTFGNSINGFVYYFAMWGRAISASEALLLHEDPYCFLIYPEDEMFATLIGAASSIITLIGGSAELYAPKLGPDWRPMGFRPRLAFSNRIASAFNQTVSITSASSMSLNRDAAKSVQVTNASTITIAGAAAKSVAVICASSILLVKSAAKSIAATCASTITILKQTVKPIAAVCATSTTIIALKVILKTIAVGCSTSVSLVKSAAHGLAVTCSSAVSYTKAVTKTLAIACATSATVSAIRVFLKTLTVGCASTVSLVKNASKVVAIAGSGAVTLARSVGKTAAVTCSGAISATRSTAHRVTLACTTSTTAGAIRVFLKTITVGCSSAVSLTRAVGKSIAVFSAVGAVTVTKGMAKSLAVASASAVSATRSIGKRVAVACTTSTTSSAFRVFLKTISIGCSSVVTISRAIGKQISAPLTASVRVVKGIAKTLTAAMSAAVAVIASFISGTVITVLRFLDVHGAMPPAEFGSEIPAGAPQKSTPSIQNIAVTDPGYRKLTDKGALD
jgi:hypothetical protein